MKDKLGVLFDWDGVVVDSSKSHEESWEWLAQEEGLPLPKDHFLKGFGKKNEWIIPNLLNWTQQKEEIHRLSLKKEYLYREVLKKTGLQALPGVEKLLENLVQNKVPCIVATSSHKKNIEVSLDLLGFHKYFQGIISSEDVSLGKPDPEVFAKAANKIEVPVERCVVFEDSYAGIEAGKKGGMWVAGVATTHSMHELEDTKHSPDVILSSLEDVSITLIQSWIATHTAQH